MASDRRAGSASEQTPALPETLHEVLVAWQAGRLTARQAMYLCGLEGFADLYAAASSSGVPLRKTLLPAEKKAANLATAAIRNRMAMEGKDRP